MKIANVLTCFAWYLPYVLISFESENFSYAKSRAVDQRIHEHRTGTFADRKSPGYYVTHVGASSVAGIFSQGMF